MARAPRRGRRAASGDDETKPLGNRRLGRWAWALTGEEGLTALVASQAVLAGTPLDPADARRYERMLSKQKKLELRFPERVTRAYR